MTCPNRLSSGRFAESSACVMRGHSLTPGPTILGWFLLVASGFLYWQRPKGYNSLAWFCFGRFWILIYWQRPNGFSMLLPWIDNFGRWFVLSGLRLNLSVAFDFLYLIATEYIFCWGSGTIRWYEAYKDLPLACCPFRTGPVSWPSTVRRS